MNRPSCKTCLRWVWLFVLFAVGSSIGWMDRYYWSLRRFYRANEGLGLARAYAQDFERQHDRLPAIAELIPFAEKRFHEDLEKMDFANEGDQFRWKPEVP
jgi:hypothetical protein